jgi:two-component system NarL family response regulator
LSAAGEAAVAAAQESVKRDGESGGKRPDPIRVLIADDHALFRRGLEMVLEEEDDIDLVGQASDGAEAVAAAGESLPDVVLMDIRMPKTS